MNATRQNAARRIREGKAPPQTLEILRFLAAGTNDATMKDIVGHMRGLGYKSRTFYDMVNALADVELAERGEVGGAVSWRITPAGRNYCVGTSPGAELSTKVTPETTMIDNDNLDSDFEGGVADSETDEEGVADDDRLQVEPGAKKVVYQPSNPTIQTLYENFKDGDLLLSPDYQRNFVWTKQKASNLIESILLNIPLPLIYTAEIDGREEVVDGQQRLTSIFAFIDGRFPGEEKPFRLSRRLKVLSEEIGGRTFAELGKKHQREIKRRSLQIIAISEESQEDVKFEMFERLNTNITPLNAQELRNCLYQGPYSDFIKNLAKYDDFQYVLNQPKFAARMKDVENVLMFCAFYHTPPDRYSKSLTQVLNEEMRNQRQISAGQMAEIGNEFKKSVRLIKHIWGKRAFNIFSVDPATKRGSWSRTFNQGLYQILMYWFVPFQPQQVIAHADLIREELLSLQIHNREFIDTLTGSGTNSPAKVRKKFDIWGSTLKGILEYPTAEPRAFSLELKNALWEESQTCRICGQQIATIDDAEVDHITCYWRGGKTVPENARLTHRFCNRSRGGGYAD